MVLDLTRLDLDSRVVVPCARRLRPHFVFRSVVLLEVCFLSSCWCLVGGCQVSRRCPVCKGKFFFCFCLVVCLIISIWVSGYYFCGRTLTSIGDFGQRKTMSSPTCIASSGKHVTFGATKCNIYRYGTCGGCCVVFVVVSFARNRPRRPTRSRRSWKLVKRRRSIRAERSPGPKPRVRRFVPYRAVPCRTVPYRAVPCRTVPYRAVPCRTVPYRAVPCRTAMATVNPVTRRSTSS